MTTHAQDMGECSLPRVENLAPTARFSLRARNDDLDRLGGVLGLTLPRRVGDRAAAAGREALCLGPDEWMIVAPVADGPDLVAAMVAAYAASPHAFADISDRELSCRIVGPGTLDILAMGCPRDMAQIPPGRGARTIFHGAAVVLWRDGPEEVRLDVWRSFAPHVRALIETGLRELRAGL